MLNNERPPIYSISSDEINQKRQEIENNELTNSLLTGTAVVGGLWGADQVIKKSSTIQSYLTKRGRLQSLNSSASNISGYQTWQDMTGYANRPIGITELSFQSVRALEEYSPFKILRTFDASHFAMPFAAGKEVNYRIQAKAVSLEEEYFSKLLASRGNRSLNRFDTKYGFQLQNGKLYGFDSSGNVNYSDIVLNEARLTSTEFSTTNHINADRAEYRNRVFDHFRNILGVESSFNHKKLSNAKLDSLMVIGGRSKEAMSFDWSRAYARATFERGAKVWDEAFGYLSEVPVLERSESYRRFVGMFKTGLGTGGNYKESIPKSLGLITKNVGTKILVGGAGYYAIDKLIRSAAGDDETNPWSKGLAEGVSTMYVNARIGLAETLFDPLQGYKQKQEELAPGSTDFLAGAVALPAIGVLLGGMSSYGQRVWEGITKGIDQADLEAAKKAKLHPRINIEMTRGMRRMAGGGLIGLALTAPFLPGALIGESSEELRREYSGETDIAVRANRWWFSGAGDYEGDKIKYFTKNWYARLMSGSDDASKYGDQQTKDQMNPFLNPFDFLRNPYQFEEMHQEDRPYPVWGLDISVGAFIGKAFERTIGQLIKPDVINPNLQTNLAAGTGLEGGATALAESGQPLSLAVPVSESDASLIAEGKVKPPESPRYAPNSEALSWSWDAFKDFIGLRGWAASLAEDGTGLNVNEGPLQLARSGEATNAAREIRDLNMGGALGGTEALRRFIPTSAGMIEERYNPLKNNMPSWMPGSDSKFWIDFSVGDPYTKVELGESRLPGAGYAALHPELKGINPEDYPDIHKFKILSDTSLGSKEYYSIKNIMEKRSREGNLSEYEQAIYETVKQQELERSVKKKFVEYKTEEELSRLNVFERAYSRLWETISHNAETPVENLTFFRPGGKMIHARTAIEDYEKTQIVAPDLALWNKPIDHFIKPTYRSAIQIVDETYVPEEVEEKRNVDEYFDNLEYLKYRRLYKEAVDSGEGNTRLYQLAYQKTMQGAVASEIDTEREAVRAYISLPENERPYFGSFVNANESDRNRILEITPESVGDLYKTIWARKDAIKEAIERGASNEEVDSAIQEQIQNENQQLIKDNPEAYKEYKNNGEQYGTFKEFLADKEAEHYVSETTGMPDDKFIGWDPRIEMDDIKLQTVSVGKDDVHKFGFWKSDVNELARQTAILEDTQVTNRLEQIKQKIKNDKKLSNDIEDSFYRNGYDVKKLEVVDSGNSEININVVNS